MNDVLDVTIAGGKTNANFAGHGDPFQLQQAVANWQPSNRTWDRFQILVPDFRAFSISIYSVGLAGPLEFRCGRHPAGVEIVRLDRARIPLIKHPWHEPEKCGIIYSLLGHARSVISSYYVHTDSFAQPYRLFGLSPFPHLAPQLARCDRRSVLADPHVAMVRTIA